MLRAGDTQQESRAGFGIVLAMFEVHRGNRQHPTERQKKGKEKSDEG
jgi:hypothetical protein